MSLDVGHHPVPHRPRSAGSYHHQPVHRPLAEPSPIPQLPPNFTSFRDDMYRSQSADPYFVPQHRPPMGNVYPNAPHALDEHFRVSSPYNNATRFAPIPPPPRQKTQSQMTSHVPSFASDAYSYSSLALSPPSVLPPPSLSTAETRNGEVSVDFGSAITAMGATALNETLPLRVRSVHGVTDYSGSPSFVPSPPSTSVVPQLAAPLPSLAALQNALPVVQSPAADVSSQVAWIRDILLLVQRACTAEERFTQSSALPLASNSLPSGPVQISDKSLKHLADSAVALLVSIVPTSPNRDTKLTPLLAEALYIHATLAASGAFPELIAASPRTAFREFEAAARAGFARGWFRLGRDYEGFDDTAHARQCFERGMAANDPGCIYRIGMAMLLGQLDFPAKSAEGVRRAVQLLHQAATLATIDFAHPPYVFALFLLGEFETVRIPPDVLVEYIPAGSNSLQEARRHLVRSAFLHFAPAQQRIGRAYEFEEPPFPYDPNLSVEYYSMASAGGDAQADLALSKWYLCGAENFFGKDEGLARDYAARAASRELPAAMFAMGYYCEVGIGGPSDVTQARQWYEKAAAHGEVEAEERLRALNESSVPLSREQHNTLAETRLVRSRTQARIRSNAAYEQTSQQGSMHRQNGQVYQRRQASLSSYAPPADQYGYPAQAPQYRPIPQHSASLPPPYQHAGSHTFRPNQAAPQMAFQQQFADRLRYSLVDPGVAQPSGSVNPGSVNPVSSYNAVHHLAPVGAPLSSMRRQYNGQSVFTSSPQGSPLGSPHTEVSALPSETNPPSNSQSKATARYNTFADMGIEGGRAQDKECRIM